MCPPNSLTRLTRIMKEELGEELSDPSLDKAASRILTILNRTMAQNKKRILREASDNLSDSAAIELMEYTNSL